MFIYLFNNWTLLIFCACTQITKNVYYFSDYVDRFHSLFPYEDKKVVLVGNHDIGFHYDVTDKKRKRFYGAFAQDISG